MKKDKQETRKIKEKKEKKKHPILKKIILVVIALFVLAVLVYARYGGFGTGESADKEAFKKYADAELNIRVPNGTEIIALGEATHGNREFQELKLEVFKQMVENYDVKAFCLEADAGCCENANEFIHGGKGTAEEAATSLGFQIYRTDEMAELLQWMRAYNDKASEGEDLRFYGFDMQRYEDNYNYFLAGAKQLGVVTTGLEKVWHDGKLDETYTSEQITNIVKNVQKDVLARGGIDAEKVAYFGDAILQNMKLGKVEADEMTSLRDELMADNVMWLLNHEQKMGHSRIFISAHNGHIDQYSSYDEDHKCMGNILAYNVGEKAYFAIGTDFYKAKVNLPVNESKRTKRVVFSHDALAKASKKCGYQMSWLDFSKISKTDEFYKSISEYCWMGSLGEVNNTFLNSVIMSIMPRTYRVWGNPDLMYDGMIFVKNAHPIEIK